MKVTYKGQLQLGLGVMATEEAYMADCLRLSAVTLHNVLE